MVLENLALLREVLHGHLVLAARLNKVIELWSLHLEHLRLLGASMRVFEVSTMHVELSDCHTFD